MGIINSAVTGLQLRLWLRTHDVLADVSDGLERGLLHVLSAAGVRHIGHQLRDELGPLVHWDLCARDASHTLGR